MEKPRIGKEGLRTKRKGHGEQMQRKINNNIRWQILIPKYDWKKLSSTVFGGGPPTERKLLDSSWTVFNEYTLVKWYQSVSQTVSFPLFSFRCNQTKTVLFLYSSVVVPPKKKKLILILFFLSFFKIPIWLWRRFRLE